VKWYEFDPTYPIVKLLHASGIIKLKTAWHLSVQLI
jgi:stearoyl-CoA desaturase (delta-9 desaturase)